MGDLSKKGGGEKCSDCSREPLHLSAAGDNVEKDGKEQPKIAECKKTRTKRKNIEGSRGATVDSKMDKRSPKALGHTI